MFSITVGTLLYDIPLPKPLKFRRGFPLVIRQDDNVIIECPYFDEYGYGKTFDESMKDLGSSIIDFYNSLKGQANLSQELKTILIRMGEEIV